MRERRRQAGNCIKCGLARSRKSKQLCPKHLKLQAAYVLKRDRAKRAKVRAEMKAAGQPWQDGRKR